MIRPPSHNFRFIIGYPRNVIFAYFLNEIQAKIKTELQETKEKLSAKDCELKKARRQIESLTDDVNALKGIRRFDPKKAFQTRAEN